MFFALATPSIIFLFLNEVIFFSKESQSDSTGKKRTHKRKLGKLILVSPIGLFALISVLLVIVYMLSDAVMSAMGLMEYTDEYVFLPTLSASNLLGISSERCFSNTELFGIMLISVIIAFPVLLLVIRGYKKVVGCGTGLAVFVYMAVLFMYVTSALITLPVSGGESTFSSLISSGIFIILLLIFYLPAADNIEFMRKKESQGVLKNINTLPIINFILLLLLFALEIMLDYNNNLDFAYYAIILIFAIILYVASQLSYSVLFKHIEERIRIEELSKESLASQEQVSLAFAEITEAKSGQTGQHIKRVSEYSRVLAQEMGLPRNEVENIRIASMMHDIGKLLIPPEILEKAGRFTNEEFEIMKTHVTIGENLLHNAPGEIMGVARVIAQQHHEWWNGGGYIGMKGEEIALSARITAVADVYDALTSNRSYKKAWYSDQAYEMIINESGEHFDPDVVEAFKNCFDKILSLQAAYSDSNKTEDKTGNEKSEVL